MEIAMVVCEFDSDHEIANLANQLNCPVLSYDSDFYIFDVKYIPFFLGDRQNLYVLRKLEHLGTPRRQWRSNLRCKIFNRKQFLARTNLSKDKLKILSVFLGNDTIPRVTTIDDFCNYLQLGPGRFSVNVIKWLASKSVPEAIEKMKNYYKDEATRESMMVLINETIDKINVKTVNI